MQNEPLKLFIELNNYEFVFAVGKNIEENEFNLIFVNSINNNINNIKNNFDEYIDNQKFSDFSRRRLKLLNKINFQSRINADVFQIENQLYAIIQLKSFLFWKKYQGKEI